MNTLAHIQLFLILPVIIVSLLFPTRIEKKMAIIIISPVILFSLFLLINHSTVDLVFFPLGLLLGCLLFVFSLWITEETSLIASLKKYKHNFHTCFKQGLKQFQEWNSILYITLMAIYEELIWRVFLVESLSLYLPAIPLILIASFLFYYSHANQRELTRQAADLFLFSLFITSIYFFTQSFVLAFLIHWIRNLIIIINSSGANELARK